MGSIGRERWQESPRGTHEESGARAGRREGVGDGSGAHLGWPVHTVRCSTDGMVPGVTREPTIIE
jgi:hypothetical protein